MCSVSRFVKECRGQCEQAVTDDDNKLRERYKEKTAELRQLQSKVFVSVLWFSICSSRV